MQEYRVCFHVRLCGMVLDDVDRRTGEDDGRRGAEFDGSTPG